MFGFSFRPGRNLIPSVSCKPKYSEQLLSTLHSFVSNPSYLSNINSEGLRGGSKNFCTTILKQVEEKRKLKEQMKDIKTKMNMSDEMKRK